MLLFSYTQFCNRFNLRRRGICMEVYIKNAKILLGEDLTLTEGKVLWVKDGVIKKIDNKLSPPTDAYVVDAKNKVLLPGLIDSHVHLMWDGSLNPVQTLKEEGYEQMIIRAVSNCQTYLNNGITTVRDVGSVDDISLHVARAVKNDLISGPNIISSGKTLTMTGGHDPFWARFVDGKEEALKGVREQIFSGAKVIKVSATGGVYGRTEGEEVGNAELNEDELAVICDEAHKFGLKVASHAIGRKGILNSINAGVDTIEHGQYLDEELIEKMNKKNIAWNPTLFVYNQIANQDSIPKYAQKKATEIVERHVKVFKKFFYRDILIGAGSDAGSPLTPHPTLLEELLLMNKYIEDKTNILKTATVNAGKIIGEKIGQIKEGYTADFIIVNGNPLDNLDCLKNIEKVFRLGYEHK